MGIVFFGVISHKANCQDSTLIDFGIGYKKLPIELLYTGLDSNQIYFSFNRLISNNNTKYENTFTSSDHLTCIAKKKKIHKEYISVSFGVKHKIILYFTLSDKLRSYIEIEGKKFILDSLHFGSGYDDNTKERYSISTALNPFGVFCAFEISCLNSDYLLLYSGYLGGNNSVVDIKPLLFKVNNQDVTFIDFGDIYQETTSPNCFNDFDNDGQLDYLNYSYTNNSDATFYHIGDKTLIKTPFYLNIKQDISEKKYSFMPLIIIDKCNWFKKVR